MPKDLTHVIYQDKIIKCRCGVVVGRASFHSQVLILESGLTLFNYACWLCGSCKRFYNSWLAPALPNEKPENQFPDIGEIQTKALNIKAKSKGLSELRQG